MAGHKVRKRTVQYIVDKEYLLIRLVAVIIIIIIIIIIIQSALQPLVGLGLLYDFVPQSSIFTLLSPVSHFHLL